LVAVILYGITRVSLAAAFLTWLVRCSVRVPAPTAFRPRFACARFGPFSAPLSFRIVPGRVSALLVSSGVLGRGARRRQLMRKSALSLVLRAPFAVVNLTAVCS
jgi:hypothetical protein